MIIVYYVLIIIFLIVLAYYLNRKINLANRRKFINQMKLERKKLDSFNNINEWSYQRFSNFFDIVKPSDPKFDEKIEIIYDNIVNKKVEDLDEIAKVSNCSFDELVLKIMYLKNKKKIEDLYIDKNAHIIRKCDEKDKALFDKYSKYIYNYHYQPREIALKFPNADINNLDNLTEIVLNDLSYLDDKYLISGINIDKVDKKIIYYSVEKHKREKNYISINCEKCGALVEVPHFGKAKCPYCKNIIVDNFENKERV